MKAMLKSFYFGSIDDQNRLLVERNLLTDPELLIDFFDLKRSIEAAEMIPEGPSTSVWVRLIKKNIEPRKKMIFTISMGALVAACVFLFWISGFHRPAQIPVASHEILFDSIRELPVNSNVL